MVTVDSKELRKKYFDALQSEEDENQFKHLRNDNVDYFKGKSITVNVIEHVLQFGNEREISQLKKILKVADIRGDIPLKTYELAVNKKRMDLFRKLLKKQTPNDVKRNALFKIALEKNDFKSIDFFSENYTPTKSKKKPKSSSLRRINLSNSKKESDAVDSGKPPITDPLQRMRAELDELYIQSNPRYLFTNKDDPVKATIKISKKLVKYKKEFPQNKDEIEGLITRCQDFMKTIVGLCETNDEVGCLMNKKSKQKKIKKRGRLWKALDGELTECVTHPNTQSWLYGKWLGNMSSKWEKKSWKGQIAYVLPRFVLFPIMSLYYSVVPDKKITPINCFIQSVASYYFFLLALLVTIFEDSVLPTSQLNNKDQYITVAQYVVIVWLVSYFFLTIVDFTFITYPSHRHAWWTIYQFVMLCMFWIAGACKLLIRMDIELLSKKYLLITSDGCYAIAVTLAFMKILHWFHLSATLGPVIISFSKMTTVICQMIIIFAVVLFSFSFGMHSLYRNANFPDQDEDDKLDDDKTFFNNYVNTLKMLFWVIFGYGRASAAGIPGNETSINKTSINSSSNAVIEDIEMDRKNIITQIGYYMWALFHVTFVVVLLNMLIAIMTTSYELIQEKSDVKWKRARTKIWLYYMGKHNAVPPPFNIVKYVRNAIVRICRAFTQKNAKPDNGNAESSEETSNKNEYMELIRTLASRYRTKYWIDECPNVAKKNEINDSVHL